MLQRKVQRALSIRIDSSELHEALDALEEFYEDNTAASRRALKTTMAKRNIQATRDLLQATEPIEQTILDMGTALNAIDDDVALIAKRLFEAASNTDALLEKISQLHHERFAKFLSFS
jgi:RNA processing factor Prp31